MSAPPKRIAADIAELRKPEYAAMGIEQEPCETNVAKGWGLVIGPPDTPQADLPIAFEFTIPSTYPFDSPAVQVRTSDGDTRFHPNLYVNGKVCLSILGTWSGPSWASTMRLSTVLVTIQSLLDNHPIRHEPSWEQKTHEGQNLYVEHQAIAQTLGLQETLLNQQPLAEQYKPFEETLTARCAGTLSRLVDRLQKLCEHETVIQAVPYKSRVVPMKTSQGKMLEKARKLKERVPQP